jgi:hypothetical protein
MALYPRPVSGTDAYAASRARQTPLRIAQTWTWATDLAAAFGRLAALPRPSS